MTQSTDLNPAAQKILDAMVAKMNVDERFKSLTDYPMFDLFQTMIAMRMQPGKNSMSDFFKQLESSERQDLVDLMLDYLMFGMSMAKAVDTMSSYADSEATLEVYKVSKDIYINYGKKSVTNILNTLEDFAVDNLEKK